MRRKAVQIMIKTIQRRLDAILHWNISFVGGFLGGYAILSHAGVFGSAQTGNLMEMASNVRFMEWEEVGLRLLAMVIFAVGLSIGKAGVYVLPFAGCTVAFFWPTFIVICMRYWKEDAAVPVSCILPIQSSMGIPIQLFLGWLNDRFGHGTAYWSTVPTIGIALALLVVFHFILLRKEKLEKKDMEQGLLEKQNMEQGLLDPAATADASAATASEIAK